MNKAKLIELMSKATKLSKAACRDCLDAVITEVSKALKGKKQVVLTGFGTFSTVQRKSRKGINPSTGKTMTIPAKTVAKFKPGKALKEMVN